MRHYIEQKKNSSMRWREMRKEIKRIRKITDIAEAAKNEGILKLLVEKCMIFTNKVIMANS